MPDLENPHADILSLFGGKLTADDLIDADRRGPVARQRQLETEPLPDTIYDVFADAAAEIPEQTAWVFFEQDVHLTYAEALNRIDRLAAGLHAMGIGKGSHVGVMLDNGPAFPITWLALGRLGAVMLPINTRYTAPELEYVLNDGDAEFLIIDQGHLDLLDRVDTRPDALTPEHVIVHGGAAGTHDWDAVLASGSADFEPPAIVGPDDLMNIQYTSGTTGFPKGCLLRHRYWVGTSKVTARREVRALSPAQ